ncbi:pleckstrin g-protein interacting- domain-containing protein [Leptolyngbya sp. Heron Island J]|uniref:DEP domain-containing protein n=1 Tax=Leptolyngbya sp. Heron Island J TaxID=1385935 RepID=UPI0003B9DDF8|nr:DEP domain-containing protein [Leptolyngbya sp. Heron Island J]ESA34933.1 pleckstrin g-protein interacting- domain-containing protein [Leptolyngbya sp. Heron Island J]
MVSKTKVETVAVACLNLKIFYSKAEALVTDFNNLYPQYDYESLVQWILAGDVTYVDQKLKLAPYVTPEALEQLVTQMRSSSAGISIKDRRYKLKVYPKCFIGNEAVDWLINNANLTPHEAIRVGQRMLERHIIHHVLDEQDFENNHFFYRFYVDE